VSKIPAIHVVLVTKRSQTRAILCETVASSPWMFPWIPILNAQTMSLKQCHFFAAAAKLQMPSNQFLHIGPVFCWPCALQLLQRFCIGAVGCNQLEQHNQNWCCLMKSIRMHGQPYVGQDIQPSALMLEAHQVGLDFNFGHVTTSIQRTSDSWCHLRGPQVKSGGPHTLSFAWTHLGKAKSKCGIALSLPWKTACGRSPLMEKAESSGQHIPTNAWISQMGSRTMVGKRRYGIVTMLRGVVVRRTFLSLPMQWTVFGVLGRLGLLAR